MMKATLFGQLVSEAKYKPHPSLNSAEFDPRKPAQMASAMCAVHVPSDVAEPLLVRLVAYGRTAGKLLAHEAGDYVEAEGQIALRGEQIELRVLSLVSPKGRSES